MAALSSNNAAMICRSFLFLSMAVCISAHGHQQSLKGKPPAVGNDLAQLLEHKLKPLTDIVLKHYVPKDKAPALKTLGGLAASIIADIGKLGAICDGKTDTTKALQAAWASACGATGKQTLLIPKGDYMTGSLLFVGPCKGQVTIQLDGNLLGTSDLSQYKNDKWILVKHVSNLVITGTGTLDGQGPGVWQKNSCDHKYDCKKLPTSMELEFVNSSSISGITFKDAKFFHLKVTDSTDITITGVTVTAPEDSPNTDGIHIGRSSRVTISGATIGTGDDCVSIGAGTRDINVTGVTCGPGHGISVGSLGRYKDETDVCDVNIRDCTLRNTANGIRIKTYDDAACVLTASKINFENITMEEVTNPIIIDMKYCPNKICPKLGGKKVTVRDVTFKHISGTSLNPEVVKFMCSEKMPCTGMQMIDVKVQYAGAKRNKTMAICNNAVVKAMGCLSALACDA